MRRIAPTRSARSAAMCYRPSTSRRAPRRRAAPPRMPDKGLNPRLVNPRQALALAVSRLPWGCGAGGAWATSAVAGEAPPPLTRGGGGGGGRPPLLVAVPWRLTAARKVEGAQLLLHSVWKTCIRASGTDTVRTPCMTPCLHHAYTMHVHVPCVHNASHPMQARIKVNGTDTVIGNYDNDLAAAL
eukprot:scaffold4079_cov41-Phaeocystis_antarctica.AAC.1